jgi:hypothetical protein
VNVGIFGFPNPRSGNLLEVKNFETSGSYSIPSGARYITMLVVGGGAGGGSGARQAAGTNSFGGGAGGGGQVFYDTFCVDGYAAFGPTLLVLIGAGGAGGAAQTVNTSNGFDGTAGGNTYVTFHGKNPLTFLFAYAAGGDRGRQGTASSGAGGSGRTAMLHKMTAVSASAPSGVTNAGGAYTHDRFAGNHGAAGSGVNSTNTEATSGGLISYGGPANVYTGFFNPAFQAPNGTLVAGGSSTNAYNGEDGSARGFYIGGDSFMNGLGGGGGCGRSSAVAGNGGNGYRGGGGGGGGGSRNGFNSGAGGKGGDGYVCFWVWG